MCLGLLQVFEFLDSDLEALIKAKGVVLSAAHIKAYMQVGAAGWWSVCGRGVLGLLAEHGRC